MATIAPEDFYVGAIFVTLGRAETRRRRAIRDKFTYRSPQKTAKLPPISAKKPSNTSKKYEPSGYLKE